MGGKYQNGALPNGYAVLPTLPTPTAAAVAAGVSGGSSWRTEKLGHLVAIAKSTVPYLLFLFIYGINQQIHILPLLSDLTCLTLHNVSSWERLVLPAGFFPHHAVSGASSPALDVLSAVPYLIHYVIPVLYPAYLYVRGQQVDSICRFYWLVGWTMWAMYVIWFFLPTAPPWVYEGPTAAIPSSPHIPADTSTAAATKHPPVIHKEGCAFARLDARLGVPFFFNLFASNPVPFGSFPSGHVCWPMCILIVAPPGGPRVFALYVGWVYWATLYSCHHYLLDGLAAIALVLAINKFLFMDKAPLMGRRFTSLVREPVCGSCPGVVCPLNMV